jgi:hypothetical protein
MKRLLLLLAAALIAKPTFAYHPQWTQTASSSDVYAVRSAVAADFNGDGRADVVSRTDYHQVYLSLTQPGGLPGQPFPIYTADYLASMIVADVDGDGHDDLVLSDTATNSIVVLRASGGGGFDAPVISALALAPTQIVAGDFDGDGKVDLGLRSYSANSLAVLHGDGAGHFSEITRLSLDGLAAYRVVAGDIDHDGKTDLLLATGNPAALSLYYGKGDGTFDAPLAVTGATTISPQIALADLDGDGDLEIISCEFATNTVTVVLNLGSRAFAAPASYAAIAADLNPSNFGNPFDIAVLDVNGDGKRDVVVTLANAKLIGTLTGNGTGALAPAVYSGVPQTDYYYSTFPDYLAPGDFDGDGRIDLAIVSTFVSEVLYFHNAAGVMNARLSAQYPTISVGQSAKLNVTASPADSYQGAYGHPAPYATGSVTIRNGATVMGTATLHEGSATVDIPSLAAGTYNLTATIADDGNYRQAVSNEAAEKVIAESTTVTLTTDAAGNIPFGTQFSLSAAIPSPLPGTPQGQFWLYTDGVRSEYTSGGPPASWYQYGSLPVGTHTFYTTYEGSTSQPPATSNVLTVTVRKGTAVATLSGPSIVRSGETPNMRVELGAQPFGAVPGGNVRLYEGQTLLGSAFADNSCCSGGMSVYIPLPLLPAGVHYVHADYEGSTNFLPAQTATMRVTVASAGPFIIDASVNGGFVTVLSATVPFGAGHYEIYRRIGSGVWTRVNANASSANFQEAVTGNTVYAYRMDAFSFSNQLMATSNTDVVYTTTFTDDPLVPGTLIKAQHVQELVTAINAVRSAGGLSPIALPGAAPGLPIQAAHIATLRTALNEARIAFGAAMPPYNSNADAGSVIRVQDIQDLREGLR